MRAKPYPLDLADLIRPGVLLSAVAVGIAAALAWRYRERIRDAAEPLLEAAAERLPWRRTEPDLPEPTLH